MIDRPIGHGEQPARSTKARMPSRRSLVRPLALAASCAAVAAITALAWQTVQAPGARTASAGDVPASRAVMASSSAERVAGPARLAPDAGAAPVPAIRSAEEVPAAIAQQLAALKAAHDDLVEQVQQKDQRLDRVEAEVAELRSRFEKSHVAQAKAERRARALAQRLQAAQAAGSQTQTVPLQPTVLSIDMWNGRPSVSVKVGDEVRFFSEGDVVANALVRKADPASQRVELVSASGASVTTATVFREEAR